MIIDNSYLDAFVNKKITFYTTFVGDIREICDGRKNKNISESNEEQCVNELVSVIL